MNLVILKKSLGTKFICKNDFFSKFRDEKRTFPNSETKTKFYAKV